jgi:hypothetical protein
MEDLYLRVQLLQSEARAAVEAGLKMGNGEEEDRPGLDARTRLPPVLQAPKTPTSVRVVGRRRRIRAVHPVCAHRCRASAAIDAGARNFSPPDPL